MRYLRALLLLAGLIGLGQGTAFAEGSGTGAPAAVPVVPTPAISNPAFRQPVVLSGTLGLLHVQMQLRPKQDEEDGLEGEYRLAEKSARPPVLLAGEISGSQLSLEESADGKDVSGEWDGQISGNKISGTWLSADGLRSEKFELQFSPALPNTKSAGAKNGAKR